MWCLYFVLIVFIIWFNFFVFYSFFWWMIVEFEIKLIVKFLIINSEFIEIELVFIMEVWNFIRELNVMWGLEIVEDVIGLKNFRSWRVVCNFCWRKCLIFIIFFIFKWLLVGIFFGLEKYFILKFLVYIGGVFFLNGGCEFWSLFVNVVYKYL